MMNMNILAVVTPPSIYNCCSTRKTLWGEMFTDEETFFSDLNVKNCGRRNVRKHRDIKGSEKYVTLDISLKIDSLDNMKITSSESKGKFERSGKCLIISICFKAKARPNKYKKSKCAIGNFSNKELSKIIREFEKLPYESYKKKRPKHEPTDRYFYPARQIVKCMMRADALNYHNYPVRMVMTDPSSQLYSTYKSELKEFLFNETLLQSCSIDKDESKGIVVDECSTEEDKSECAIKKEKKPKERGYI